MKGFGKAVRDRLTTAGCVFVRHGMGEHDIWRTVDGKATIVPVKIMSRHTANDILKDANLPKAF